MKCVMVSRVKLEREYRCLIDFALDNAGTIPAKGFSLKKDEPLMLRLNDIEVEMKEFIRVYKENKNLRAELGLAIEVLKFYAAEDNYDMHETYGKTNVRDDNGKIAREVLNALHVD